MEAIYDKAWNKLKKQKTSNSASEDLRHKLLFSISTRNEEAVTFYLRSGVDPNVRAKNNATPLHMCAERNLGNMAKIIIKNRKTNINLGNIYGMTPLNTAARHGATDVVRVLLEHGASITITNSMNNTPLHNAVIANHTEVVVLLLSYGANPNLFNCFYFTPLFIAANDKDHYEITKILLQNGAHPNFWDTQHTMPLLLECCLSCKSDEKVKIIRLLLKRGADVNIICNLTGNSALHVVAITGYRILIRVLLRHGANKSIVNKKGSTPYELALQHGHYEAASILQHRTETNTQFAEMTHKLIPH